MSGSQTITVERLKALVSETSPRTKLFVVLGMSAAFGMVQLQNWLGGGVCRSKARIDGKTVVITGANTGIGLETAVELAKRGGNVVIACRDMVKGEQAREHIVEQANVSVNRVKLVHLNLASLDSVRATAKELLDSQPEIQYLINNAGLACIAGKTKDGFDMQFGVNHLGHFLLTHLLLDRLKESSPARIINVSSIAHERGKIDLEDLNFERRPYSSLQAYCQSKLANVLFTTELSKRLEGTGVSTFSLHPGAVHTELGRYLPSFLKWAFSVIGATFFKTAKQGAQTTLHCVLDLHLEDKSGLYFSDCKPMTPAPQAMDAEMAEKLWLVSQKLVGIETD